MIKTHRWMNIKDKININQLLPKEEYEKRFCPPHYMPHKLPIGKKICDEKCHIHRAKWRWPTT